MGAYVLPGKPPIALTLRRSARARRITLRVSSLDGRVTLTLPRGVSETEALSFAREKEAWLRRHLEARPTAQRIAPGAVVPFRGQSYELVSQPGRKVEVSAPHLRLNLQDGQGGPRLRAWMKAQARAELVTACDHYAAKLGKPYASLTLRDTRSRWGSCSARGGLNFSWRLIMAPEDVLNYVAAHEVAHLAHMNHAPAFWAEVHHLYGAHDIQRRWLKDHGAALHAIDFSPVSL